MQVTVNVNGEDYTRDVEPRLLLIHFLRDTLGLTGSHWACDTSNCGVCTVMMDGKSVKSCTILAVMAAGHQVVTVEGLASGAELDPIQAGFEACHGLQCGFCTPGMMMAARAFLNDNPTPTERRDPRGHLRQPLPLHGLREHRQEHPVGGTTRVVGCHV